MNNFFPHSTLKKFMNDAEARVCKIYNIERSVIHSIKRNEKSAKARFAVWSILYYENDLSLPTIGQLYERDHTTVLYGLRVAAGLNIPSELGINMGTTSVKAVEIVGKKSGQKKK